MAKALIDRLVKDRVSTPPLAAVEDRQPVSQRAKSLKDAWDRLANEPLYLVTAEIAVKVRQSSRLQDEHVGLDAETISRLQQAEVSGGYSPKISKRLQDAAAHLRALQKKMYDQFTIYSPPFRFVRDENLADVMCAIAQMQAEAAQLADELAGCYGTELRDYLTRINLILETNLSGHDLESALQYYAGRFPDPDSFANALEIRVDGPTRVASLKESLKQDASLQKELADSAVTAQQKQAEVAKLKALEQGYKVMEQSLGNAFLELEREAKSQGYEVLADLLDRAELKSDVGRFTSRDDAAWQGLIERLGVLAAHNPGLKEISQEAEGLYNTYKQARDPEEMHAVFTEFKQHLLAQMRAEKSVSPGLDQLQRALRFSDEFQSLKAEVENLGENPSPIALEALETKLTGYEESSKFRIEALKRELKKAEKRAADVAQAAAEAGAPYVDPNLGF